MAAWVERAVLRSRGSDCEDMHAGTWWNWIYLQSGDVNESSTISMLMPGPTRIMRKDGVKVVAAETSDETGHQGRL